MQGGGNQAQGVHQHCNYQGMQQFYRPNTFGAQPHNVNPVANQNNQQLQLQATQINYQPQQIPNIGYIPGQNGNKSNQHVTNSTGSQQSQQHLNPAMSKSYSKSATQSYVSGANGAASPNKSVSYYYAVGQPTMQNPGYYQNYQQSQHLATQMVNQRSKNNMLDQCGKTTLKQGFVYSNQVDSTQWTQSNVIATNQTQSGPQSFNTLQQNSYSYPHNTTVQHQTNSIAQQSGLSYSYQQTLQSFNVQKNSVISSSSLSLPSQSFKTPSNLPQTSTQNASNKGQQQQ